ncbi:uncharacterized protein EI97DRAFT_440873 [Westerdykella ornata]|uniref:Nucleoporin Nup159/Nup146 N-terminal domain-containing protein n=1 Tax=Westerdykella ornata TaxID=318751 RepID=A0A6A6JP27_WESOR|nr:uncharacterized protein EI97DRAFT_440873 [Westerdykella ornata]KAF2278400.1 hypothetical protein EI97DRAFT_440873 [Westerdykella ornata]
MAFSMNQGAANAPAVNVGAELEEIDTEWLGFKAIGGDKKVKLLPNPWPVEDLPPSSASLLSVASRRGLIAAGGPDTLVITSTEAARRAFTALEADHSHVVSAYTPDVTLSTPKLRHVAFSSDENLLVVTAESGGGLAAYNVESVLNIKGPALQLATEQVSVRALVPNPNPQLAHLFAVVLDSGRLVVADLSKGQLETLHQTNVTCVGWSNLGKALVVGLEDGSAIQYKTDGQVLAVVPRPPNVEDNYFASAVYWLGNEEFFIIHAPKPGMDDEEPGDAYYHIVRCDKGRTTFKFHKAPVEIFFKGFGPERKPPNRYSINRLRNWKPHMTDMLILAASHSEGIKLITNTSEALSTDQKAIHEFAVTNVLDNRRAELPKMAAGDEDTVTIGEAVDLSSKDKVEKPIPADDEYPYSPGPLPAFLVLNHEGNLCAWWIVYDKSIRSGEVYPGLVAASPGQPAGPAATPTPAQPQTTSGFSFNKPSFGTPSVPSFGTPSKPGLSSPSQSGSIFGKPSQPGSVFAQPSPSAFGSPSQLGSAFGKPAQPAFGAASMPGGSAFGAAGALGKQPSAWASASQASPSALANPFAAKGTEPSGFAKFGAASNGSALGAAGASPFVGLGAQKSAFSAPFGKPALSKEPSGATKSFGSTLSVGSSFGDGSTLPSWANTPAQKGSSIFGGTTSSFGSSDDAQNRQRDEATPTPQAPAQQAKSLFGLTGEFKLGSTFKGDGTSKEDLPKPTAPSGDSLFGGGFAAALGGPSTKAPETPVKKDGDEPNQRRISTTPASPPRNKFSNLFGQTPAKEPPEPVKALEPEEESPVAEEAPLPPDFVTWKPPKKADEELPPLAGSPPVKVEAPESEVPSEPLEESEGEFSVEEAEEEGEEEEGEEEEEEEAEVRPTRPKAAFTFQESATASPQIRPAAPTPPALPSATTSPAPPLLFGQAPRPNASLFQTPAPAGISKPVFPPPSNRRTENLRSPSPVRSASTSALATARRSSPFPGPGSLSASLQQHQPPKLPTPQPELSDLSDDEDERIRRELATEPEPSAQLAEFLAHQDYTGTVTKTGTAAQIEIMYRDMNSMIDTIGLNARALKAFTAFHSERRPVSREDLEEALANGQDSEWFENWTLAQIADLKALQDQLEAELDAGRVQDIVDKLSQLARLLREYAKITTKLNDIRRQIINRRDPERVESHRKAALPKELAEQQTLLRKEYARLLSLLGKAEEAAFVTKSKLSALDAERGRKRKVPTVEAVKRTIGRLIAMTEKKGSEIVVLEAEMRRLNLLAGGEARENGVAKLENGAPRTPSRPGSSRSLALRTGSPAAGTPLRSTSRRRDRMSIAELERRMQRTPEPAEQDTPRGGYGLYYTPEGSPSGGGVEGEDEAMVRGLRRLAREMEEGGVERLVEARRRRREVGGLLGEAVRKRGVRVVRVGERGA